VGAPPQENEVIGSVFRSTQKRTPCLTGGLAVLLSSTAGAAVHHDFHSLAPDNPATLSAPASGPEATALNKVLRQYGIEQGSNKARILSAWFDKVSHDPIIAARIPGGAGGLERVLLDADKREALMSTGLARLTVQDRLLYLQLFTRLLDELVPVNCFGLVDVIAVMNRITVAVMSDADAQIYLGLLYKVLVSSVSEMPERSLTPRQYTAAVDSLSRAIVIELDADPVDLDRYHFYTTHSLAATPSDVCWMTRVTLHAIARMPEGERDLFLLSIFTDSKAASHASPVDAEPAKAPLPSSTAPPDLKMP
jgi:hypothetical protein